jgi:hypothetical protein
MIATGVQWRRLEAPGIDKLQGAGVYYGGGATEALSCKGHPAPVETFRLRSPETRLYRRKDEAARHECRNAMPT